jgi:kynureninase
MAAMTARPRRRRIVTDYLNFPSDHHVLAAVAKATDSTIDVVPSRDGIHGPEDEIIDVLDDGVALVTLSATTYQSGFTYDMEKVAAAAHRAGALVLWDLSHAAGSVPVDLAGTGADLAVGCTYKYLNGGPGAPAFLYVRSELQGEIGNPIPGWMGHEDTFSFDPAHRPASGIRKLLTGTPGVLGTALIEPGVDLLLEAGMDAVRDVSLRLTGYLLELYDEHLAPRGFGLGSPRNERRGSHITLTHSDALAIDQALIAAGVVPDFRPPDGIRFGSAPLYVSFADIAGAVHRTCEIVDGGAFEVYANARPEVT